MNWALDVYEGRPQAWQRMQRRGMLTDFSWRKSAGEYVDMYAEARERAESRRGFIQ